MCQLDHLILTKSNMSLHHSDPVTIMASTIKASTIKAGIQIRDIATVATSILVMGTWGITACLAALAIPTRFLLEKFNAAASLSDHILGDIIGGRSLGGVGGCGGWVDEGFGIERGGEARHPL